jgi:CxxC motif-containing protein
MEGVFL